VIADTLSLTLYCVLEWQQRHLVNHTKKHRAHRHTSLRWDPASRGRVPLFSSTRNVRERSARVVWRVPGPGHAQRSPGGRPRSLSYPLTLLLLTQPSISRLRLDCVGYHTHDVFGVPLYLLDRSFPRICWCVSGAP